MKTIKYQLSICIVLITLLGAAGCKKKGCTDSSAVNYNSEAKKDDGSCIYEDDYSSYVTFKPVVNMSAIMYDSIMYPHPSGYDFSIETLKFFVCDMVLYKSSGDSIVLNGSHYFDCKGGPSTVEFYTKEIPAGQYTGIGFDFGLNASHNITGSFVNPPESLMEWPVPMGGGYHYMKFEGKYDSLGTAKNFNVHTGGLNGTPYHFHVQLNQSFSLSDGDLDVEIFMSLENWLQQPNEFDFNVYGSAIMGNQSAQVAIMENGTNVFALGSIY